MIINTGNRTDIPAFYSRWFYNRIEEGNVLVRNPYHPQQVTRYLLNPSLVDCIAFCTKNPEPMLSGLARLAEYHQYWAVTITPYGKDIEPYVPEAGRVMDAFCQLSERLGSRCVSWRYDPVFLTEKYDQEFHVKAFEHLAAQLAGYTDHCVISFLDLYEKTKRNFPEGKVVAKEDRLALGKAFIEIAARYDMVVRPCAEGEELADLGADCSGCQTKEILERAVGLPLRVPKTSQTRESCSCILGSDIGAYNTCGHGCSYCYANYDRETVEANMRRHDPLSPFLVGDFMDGDIVKAAKQESWIDLQISFDSMWR
ncbi:DUF1848 domain-containing protein [Ihubacter sp. rT4E-8]|uniref:DUF1848 domain-containing protein n=1 Tax=Ihubacter sp. rT4E-8 TaxID=3242369 RepID=UPI003CF20468